MPLPPPPTPENCPNCGAPVTGYTPEIEMFNMSSMGRFSPDLVGEPVHIPTLHGHFYFMCGVGR